MVLGTMISSVFGLVLVIGFGYFFGYLNDKFITTCVLYALSSVLSTHAHALLVEPTLNFQYTILTLSEALGLTFNTFTQFALISVLKYHPLLGYGFAILGSEIIKIIAILILTKRENNTSGIDFCLRLEPIQIKGQFKYLTEDQIELSK